jgi:hypothetical protein
MRCLACVAAALLAVAGCAGERDPGPPEPARLFLAGDGELTVVDVDAARVEVHELPVLAPGDPLYRIVLRGDKLVVFGFDTYVLDPERPTSPRKLGDSWYFVPSSEPDRVWLTALDRSSPETRRAIATVREMSVDGDLTFPPVPPPRGEGPLTAVGGSLVFGDRRGGLELWSPTTGEHVLRLPDAYLGPVHGDLLTWCEAESGLLHVNDVGSGDERTIHPPKGFAGFDCWSGAFSPDGRRLAVAVTRTDAPDPPRSLALVDVADREASAIDGSSVHPHYGFVAWSRDGERVFMSGGRPAERRLLEYRLGGPTAVEIPVRVGPFYGMAAG